MTRPRKQNATQLSRFVSFRLSEDEYAPLEKRASRAGLRVNELARLFTCRGRRRVVIEVTRHHDPALLAQIKRIGVNLNQIVKSSHMRGFVSPKIEELCDEIRQLVLAATQDDSAA